MPTKLSPAGNRIVKIHSGSKIWLQILNTARPRVVINVPGVESHNWRWNSLHTSGENKGTYKNLKTTKQWMVEYLSQSDTFLIFQESCKFVIACEASHVKLCPYHLLKYQQITNIVKSYYSGHLFLYTHNTLCRMNATVTRSDHLIFYTPRF